MAELLYKFYPAHWGRDAIYRERVKVSTLSDINDPFEFLATSADKQLRKDARNLRNVEFSRAGVISFSRRWNEPLLWSHYAENHKGIALGFELYQDTDAHAVEYGADRVQMPEKREPLSGPTTLFWKDVSLRKYTNWEYEDEVRVFPWLSNATKENGLYFWPFKELGVLREVFLGSEYKANVDELLHDRLVRNGVSVFTTRLSFERFEVVKQKLDRFTRKI